MLLDLLLLIGINASPHFIVVPVRLPAAPLTNPAFLKVSHFSNTEFGVNSDVKVLSCVCPIETLAATELFQDQVEEGLLNQLAM